MKHLKRVAVKNKVTIQVFPKKGNTKVIPEHMTITVNKISVAKLAALSHAGATVSVVPQRMDGNGRSKENVERIRYLVVDLDRKSSMTEIKKLAMQPSIIIETSPNRFHLYYRVKCKLGNFSKYAKAIAHALDGDTQVSDLARVFRIAGTINWKNEPVRAKLRRCTEQDPILVHQLLKALGGVLPASTTTTKANPDSDDTQDKPSKKKLQGMLKKISSSDRAIWLHIGMALHSWSVTDGRSLWDQWSQSSDKFDGDEQDRTWKSFKSGGGRNVGTIYYYAELSGHNNDKAATTFPCEEHDIAKYAANSLKDQLRIVGDDSYYIFGEHHWKRDTKQATRLILNIVVDLLDVAKQTGTDYAKSRLKQHANFGAAQRLLKCLHAFPHLDANADDFDKKPDLLGVSNGVVELRTENFRDGKPEDMITITTAAAYDKKAKCPQFKKFLRSIMETQEYRTYFRQVCGYLVTGHATEQIAFIMLGNGSNGKGTITRLMEDILGREYCATISPTFMKNASKGNPNGPTPALMPLRKARLIWCTESEHKRGVDAVFFKQLTGNDTLTGRHNYGEQQSFTPPGKLVLTTNVMPDWSHEDNALWRRVKVLPFIKSFNADSGRNNDLNSLLAAEASGILNWIISGAKSYLNNGFTEAEEVTTATKEARKKSDSVHLWTQQECKENMESSIGAKAAHEAYKAFAKQQGFQAVTAKVFKHHMKRLGFPTTRKAAGVFHTGIDLLSQ